MTSPVSILFRSMIAAAFLALALAGCEREGPAEEAGENIDRAVERAGEAVEDAGDKAGERTQR